MGAEYPDGWASQVGPSGSLDECGADDRSDLFQHRLDIPSSSASTTSRIPLDLTSSPAPTFSTLHLPLSSFVLTNSGQPAQEQIPMLRSKIRTIGFALIGNNRTDDGSVPPGVAEEQAKRAGAGGWGRGKGEVEVDSELEELMRSDQPSTPAAAPPRPSSPARPPGSKYHTLNARPEVDEFDLEEETTEEGALETVQMDSEGYYELCIKSVEAVRWDPETDGVD
jgi:NADH dehydrogenase [ubiquinone] 1 alpha subcomplex assembly factor 1